ncbi:MAG: glycosyltransferase family 4 protein, partial [Bacteroidetes bacterium]|nr:glycosyltransferase family 4 protein [Bacteroidota bacterium]
PISLFEIAKWHKENTNITPIFLSLKNGSLYDTFNAVGNVFIFEDEEPFLQKPKKWYKSFFSKTRPFMDTLENTKLIYANTSVVGYSVNKIRKFKEIPTFSHIHELNGILNIFKSSINYLNNNAQYFIAASDACRNGFIESTNIPPQKIETVHEAVNVKKIKSDIKDIVPFDYAQYTSIKKPFVVGFCAHYSQRKGIDLFIRLAEMAKQKGINDIIWAALGASNNQLNYLIRKDVKYLGLDNLILLDLTSDVLPYFKSFDVFALTSREDPFPLVCLENAACGNPVICFKDGGGMPEFTDMGGGVSVDYLDLDAMLDAIIEYKNNPELLQSASQKASEVVDLFDISIAAKKIAEIFRTKFNLDIQYK